MKFERGSCVLIFFLLTLLVTRGFAQITGDYRSITDGNWDNDAIWERYNGSTWVAPGANGYPGETPVLANTTVTIIANDNVTLNVTVSIINLTIESGTFLNPTELDTSGNPTLTISGSVTKGVTGGGFRAFFTFSGTGSISIGGSLIDQGGGAISTSTFTFSSSGLMSVGGNISLSRNLDFSISGGALSTSGSFLAQGIGQTCDVLFSTGGNITIGTTTTLLSGATLTDNNNTGVSTFTGLVSNEATWLSTSVTTSANMIFRGGITNTAPGVFSAGAGTFDLLNQTLLGNGNISFSNTVTVTGVTVTHNNTGTVTMLNTAAGTLTGTGTWTQGANSTLVYSGQTITITAMNASSAGNTVNYNSTANAQTIFNPSASTYANLTLSGTGNRTKTLSANTIVSGNLSIQNTAIFSVSTFTLSVAGSWANSSTDADPFVQGTQTVTFNGTSAQTVTNTGDAQGTEFNNLTINNTFGTAPQINISNAVIVRNTLTMTQGVINLGGTTFTIGTAAGTPGSLSHSQASTAGWMYNGSLTRFVNTGTIAALANTGFFPLGNATNFRPFFIQCPATGITTGGTFTVTHSLATTTNIVSIADTGPVATIVRQHQASWSVNSASVAGGTYNLTAGGTGFGTIGALADLRLCKSASVVATHLTATNTTADPRLQRTGLTLAQITTTGGSQFFVGSSNAAGSPLPVELVSFRAEPIKNSVEFNWTTASELNNDFFTVERLTVGDFFDQIATVKGSGTINEARSYQAYDFVPNVGKNYYRLKQTDFDGKFTYSKIVMVDFQGSGESVSVYPNPTNQETITVEVKQLKPGQQVPLQIRSTLGVQTFSAIYNADSAGNIKVSIQVDQWSQGLYFIQIGTEAGIQRKMIIE